MNRLEPMPDAAPGAFMRDEIAEQPAVLARIVTDAGPHLERVVPLLRAHRTRAVLLAARGTSDHAAIYAKYLVEILLGQPVGLVSTSAYTAYDAPAQLDGVVWLAVSQSGGSPDLVASTERARDAGALTVALTNVDESPLEQAAQVRLPMLAGEERSVAATKTYTASLLWLYLLVHGWADRRADDDARRLPEQVAACLDLAGVDALVQRFRFVDRCVLTSRGYNYATAREAALKLMETCYLSAHAYSGADLLHGPLAMIDEDRPVLAVVPDGPGGRALLPVLDALSERGADVSLISPDRELPAAARVTLPAGIPEPLSPIGAIVPLQQLALRLALSRGYDPDRPRGLRKATRTT